MPFSGASIEQHLKGTAMAQIDRIAQPWGSRTPYGPGEKWPVRVDTHLAQGVDPDDVDRWVQSASILHSNGDAMDIAVKDERIVGVRGRAVDRVNHGRLDPKDLYGWQANGSSQRLTRPLIRRDGQLVETDWDTAMDAVAGRTKELLSQRGASAIGFYTTGQLFLEEYYTLGLIAHGGIGTNHVDGNTRLCTATAAAALKESFGSDGQPGSYTDIDHADVICLYGHNMPETQAVLWSRLLDRLAGPNPPAIICVDPRQTPVAHQATVHLAPRPGTNAMLMNALLHELLEHGWIDHDYVNAHAVGFAELEKTLEGYTVVDGVPVPADHRAHAVPLPHPHQDRPRPAAAGRCPRGVGRGVGRRCAGAGLAGGGLPADHYSEGSGRGPLASRRHSEGRAVPALPLRVLGHRAGRPPAGRQRVDRHRLGPGVQTADLQDRGRSSYPDFAGRRGPGAGAHDRRVSTGRCWRAADTRRRHRAGH